MPRQLGYYEWDDAGLRPGRKQEGGWHQNLFNDDGELKASARFVPCEESELGPEITHETVFVSSDARRDEFFDDEMKEAIALLLAAAVLKGVDMAMPHLKMWWGKGVGALWQRNRKPRKGKSVELSQKLGVRAKPKIGDSVELVKEDENVTKLKMSSAEAKARIVAAAAAQAFAEEQMRMVNGADIVDAKDLDEVRAQLASVPPQQLEQLTILLSRKPELLADDNLADLAAWMQRQQSELESRQAERKRIAKGPRDDSDGEVGRGVSMAPQHFDEPM